MLSPFESNRRSQTSEGRNRDTLTSQIDTGDLKVGTISPHPPVAAAELRTNPRKGARTLSWCREGELRYFYGLGQ